MNPWLLILIAGLMEVVWAMGLKYSDGFTRPLASAVTVAGILVSLYCLSLGMRQIPVGTAYAVWVGIGAVGTAIAAVILFAEPVNALRVGGIALIIAGIITLKFA
jgi:quaternary ammonium compound-resistance protein SugE